MVYVCPSLLWQSWQTIVWTGLHLNVTLHRSENRLELRQDISPPLKMSLTQNIYTHLHTSDWEASLPRSLGPCLGIWPHVKQRVGDWLGVENLENGIRNPARILFLCRGGCYSSMQQQHKEFSGGMTQPLGIQCGNSTDSVWFLGPILGPFIGSFLGQN